MEFLKKFTGRGQAASGIDYPPKQEAELTGERPDPINVDEAISRIASDGNAEQVIAGLFDPFHSAWSERRLRANVFTGNLQSDLWKMRSEAIILAQAYETKPTKTSLAKLRKQLEAINRQGELLEQQVQSHMAKLAAESQAPTPGSGTSEETVFITKNTTMGRAMVPAGTVKTSLGSDVKPSKETKKPGAESNDLGLDMKTIDLHMAGLKRHMADAERSYLEAYKRFQANKQSEDEEEPKTLKGLRDEFEKHKENYDVKLDRLIVEEVLRKSMDQPINKAGLLQHYKETILSQSTRDHETNKRNADLEVLGERMQKEMLGKLPEDKEQAMKRQEEREERARALAEKYGLTSKREAMLMVERRYAGALLLSHRSGTPIPADVEEAYTAARLKWRKALSSAPIEEGDRLAAKFIAVRDTSLRPGLVKTEAREFALSEKEEKPYAKVVAWSKRFSRILVGDVQKAASRYAAGAQWTGDKLIRGAELVTRKKFSIEDRARASRILGSAAIISSTAFFTGGATAAPVALDFLVRAMRGAVGVFAGTKAAKAAGEKYEQLKGGAVKEEVAGARQAYAETFRSKAYKNKDFGELSAEQLEREAETYTRGRAATASRKSHETKRAWIEVGTATAVGGAAAVGSSFAINPAVNALSSLIEDSARVLESVVGPENSTGAIDQQTVGGSDMTAAEAKAGLREGVRQLESVRGEAATPFDAESTPTRASDALEKMNRHIAEASGAPEAAPATSETISTITSGEGANTMFYDLKDHVEERLNSEYGGDESKLSPAERIIHDTKPEKLGEMLGFAGHVQGLNGEDLGYGSRIMYAGTPDTVGDRISLNSKGELVFTRGTETHTLIGADGKPHSLGPLTAENTTGLESPASESLELEVPVQHDVQSGESDVQVEQESGEFAPQHPEPVSDAREVPGTQESAAADETHSSTVIDVPDTEHQAGGSGAVVEVPVGTGVLSAEEIARAMEQDPSQTGTVINIPIENPPGVSSQPDASPIIEIDPISGWTPEQGLPQEPAVFTVSPESDLLSRLALPDQNGDIFYAHADSPAASLALAQEYGRLHPGAQVIFDNSQYDWGGKTPQIGSIKFADNGLAQDFKARVLDRSGDPVTRVDASQLRTRIA